MFTIDYNYGTLLVEVAESAAVDPIAPHLTYDERIGRYRAGAHLYAAIVRKLHCDGLPYDDRARAFAPCPFELSDVMMPRPLQREALAAWNAVQRRGVAVLPTGAGKSFLAMMAIADVQRPALVVVPTLDLMQQWATRLEEAFGVPVGMLGGGSKDVQDLTVSTYDSAVIMMEFIGNRFGLIVFDECHHLPGRVNRTAAAMSIAPYRLGLTATPECNDDGDAVLAELVGPICFRRDIDELEGAILAPYETHRIELPLDDDEAEAYERNRKTYIDFVRANGVNFGSPRGWQQFTGLCARMPDGRAAFNAYLAQKRIAAASRSKFRMIWDLFQRHAGECTLIFTADNNTAYALGRRFLVPVITQHTKVVERKAFLDKFRAGDYPVLVSSKVLNEGIDVPEASVGIVVSGSGSIREHVQRLGRILRPVAGKQAQLYELVSAGTSEYHISDRRRQHRAYQRSS
ncbi:MAG TPA: heavy metal transporter [Lentisphaeria bacterium]|nr:heavy metal transporter [Lentisphaeria bacterium]